MRLEVLPGLRFTCSECGDCCVGWNVAVSAEERRRIEGLDWAGRAPDLAGGGHVVRLAGAPARLARRADGACVFLGGRRQCRIHEHFGAEAKPLACQLYPFRFEALGERVAVDLAFSCRAVSEGRGEPVEQALAEWAGRIEPASRPGRVALTRGRGVAPELLWELEEAVVAILLAAQPALLDRVRAALEFARLASTGDPTTPAAAVLRATLARGIPAQMAGRPLEATLDATQRAVFGGLLYLALNPMPADFAEWPASRQAGERERREGWAERFREFRGRPVIDGRELDVDFAAVARVDPGLLRGAEPPLLARFLAAKVLGQRFRHAGADELPLVGAVERLLLLYPMALWSAAALAAGRGARAAEEADLRAALRLLDRSLGQVSLAGLPRRQHEAFAFVLEESDVVAAAASDVLAGRLGAQERTDVTS